MEPRDLVKIATHGSFTVVRSVRTGMGKYAVKRLKAGLYPAWETVADGCGRDEVGYWKKVAVPSDRCMYDADRKPDGSMLSKLSESGFRILKRYDARTLKEYCPETGRWRMYRKYDRPGDLETELWELLNVREWLLAD